MPYTLNKKLNVLILGSGGRENALGWKISQSPHLNSLWIAPGGDGMGQLSAAKSVHLDLKNHDQVIQFVKDNGIDLTIVGPEEPLCDGIVDSFHRHDLKIFGPTKKQALLESSKIYSNSMNHIFDIPCAKRYGVVSIIHKTRLTIANEIIKISEKYPVVIKKDGLAAGKGVAIANSPEEVSTAVNQLIANDPSPLELTQQYWQCKKCNDLVKNNNDRLLIEEFLEGFEVSAMAITDGTTIIPLPLVHDYKRLLNGNEGPNTGGMGGYSPVPECYVNEEQKINDILTKIMHEVHNLAITLEATKYVGIIYAGIMLTDDENPKVLEYNVRFGDPECQILMLRLKSDLLPILMAATEHKLNEIEPIRWDDRPAVGITLAAPGYPNDTKTGMEIIYQPSIHPILNPDADRDKQEKEENTKGLGQDQSIANAAIFKAAVKRYLPSIKWQVNGGRVMTVVSLGRDHEDARNYAMNLAGQFTWDGVQYRTDIGILSLITEEYNGQKE